MRSYEESKVGEMEALRTELTLAIFDKNRVLADKIESEIQLFKMEEMKFKGEYRADYQRLREVMLGHKNKSTLLDVAEPSKAKKQEQLVNGIKTNLKKGVKDTIITSQMKIDTSNIKQLKSETSNIKQMEESMTLMGNVVEQLGKSLAENNSQFEKFELSSSQSIKNLQNKVASILNIPVEQLQEAKDKIQNNRSQSPKKRSSSPKKGQKVGNKKQKGEKHDKNEGIKID